MANDSDSITKTIVKEVKLMTDWYSERSKINYRLV